MKVAFITRSTLYSVPGGDTVQIKATALGLQQLGLAIDIHLTHQPINYAAYDLLHFFNLTRPADILYHTQRTTTPYVLTPIFINYEEYDRYHRNGLSGWLFKKLSQNTVEYIKTIGRWLKQKDSLQTKSYLFLGQQKATQTILNKASLLLPNAEQEYQQLQKKYSIRCDHAIISNGLDTRLFRYHATKPKNKQLVICAARIEGIKNQLNLVKALNNTAFTLLVIGDAAPNQKKYYQACKKIAAPNIVFINRVPQDILVHYYKTAAVHVLPSWFETCGLSSMEAAAMGCNIVITDKGYTREYFGDHAFYCDPAEPSSIYEAVVAAANQPPDAAWQQMIAQQYNWKNTAMQTATAYKKIFPA